jgi:hypothetical protein
MDTCVSCKAEPKFSYEIGPAKFMLFCIPHIPGFLKRKGGALLLKPYSPATTTPIPIPTPSKTSKKKKAEPATEEPVVEETQEEVLVDEEVTPTEE